MRLELIPRPDPSPVARALAPLGALVVAFLVAGLVVALIGRSPISAFEVYILQPLTDPWSLRAILVKATPLVLIAIGLSYCFRAGLWNIGAEGQFIMGGVAGSALALATHGTDPGPWLLPAMMLAGMLGGAAWGAVPAFLKVRFGVSEILTSLFLVYIAELFLDWLARGPWRDPGGFNFPQSVVFESAARLPEIPGLDRVHVGVVFAVIAVLVTTVVLGRTLFGYRLKLTGDAPRAARFAGFSSKRTTLIVFAISGGLAGLAGIAEVSGQIGRVIPDISPGYGFTAITVAFLGRLNPVGILAAGLVLALTFIGGENAQILLRLPFDLTVAFQGLVLLCVLTADALVSYRVRLVRQAGARV